jgi:hypothetical protein
MQQISAHGGFAPQHDPFAALMSLQSERTQVVFSGLEFHPCDTGLYRTLQTRPEKRFTEASPTVACQRAHAKRTTVTQCVRPPRQDIAATHYREPSRATIVLTAKP